MIKHWFAAASVIAAIALAPAHAAGRLVIHDAWIRSAPPNSMMLAGYATLHNAGDAPLTINAVSADGYDDTSLHESVLVGDVSRMQPLAKVTIAPGASVTFAPGGKHIMLMEPSTPPRVGDHVTIHFTFAEGGEQTGDFVIRDSAPGVGDHAGMVHPAH